MPHVRHTFRILSWLLKPRRNDHAEPGSVARQDTRLFTEQMLGYWREPWLELPMLPSPLIALLGGPEETPDIELVITTAFFGGRGSLSSPFQVKTCILNNINFSETLSKGFHVSQPLKYTG